MRRAGVAAASLAPLGFALLVLVVLAALGVTGWVVVLAVAAAVALIGLICWLQLGRRRAGRVSGDHVSRTER